MEWKAEESSGRHSGRVRPGGCMASSVGCAVRCCCSLACSGFVPLPPGPPISFGLLSVTFSAPSLLSLCPFRPPTVCTVAVYRGGAVPEVVDELANERTESCELAARPRRCERHSMAAWRRDDSGSDKRAEIQTTRWDEVRGER